ncbi:MAG: DUF5615 family PIN-like protein [Solirubrobacterales bacterium]|nr:DUF5615 family PIN-like protein [Solirubrobacterales bacterium]
MRLLLDEQISGKVADRLRKMGHDVVAATADPVLRGTSDPDLFEFAQTEKRILVTYDRGDFEVILHRYVSYEQEHHGVVFVRQHRLPSRDFNRLAKALDGFEPPPGGSFVVWLQP